MEIKEESHQIYKKLRELRQSKGLTVNNLAEKMGEDSQKVGRIERGVCNLTLDYLIKVSKALEAPLTTLLVESKDKNTVSEPPSDILNDVIYYVEEFYSHHPLPIDIKQKAKLISNTYESVRKIPKDHQHCFLKTLFECMKNFTSARNIAESL